MQDLTKEIQGRIDDARKMAAECEGAGRLENARWYRGYAEGLGGLLSDILDGLTETGAKDGVISQALRRCAVSGEEEFQVNTDDKGSFWLKVVMHPNGLQSWYEPGEAPFEWVPISGEAVINREFHIIESDMPDSQLGWQ